MTEISKASASKSSLGTAVAFVFVSVITMWAPTEASAQFNIEGIIRGAIGHGGGHRYRGGSSHHRGHTSSRHEREDSDSANSNKNNDKGKDKDALDENASSHGSADTKSDANLSRRMPSTSTSSTPSRDAAQASDAAATPSRASDDEPSFVPSR
jgi:hypothetical protein